MTALSAKRTTDSKWLGNKKSYPVAASTTIYGGGLVMIDEDGYARPAASRPGNQGCVGLAVDTVDNSSGAAAALNVEAQAGLFKLAGTTLLQSHVGRLVYAEDDQTVDAARSGLEPVAGRRQREELGGDPQLRLQHSRHLPRLDQRQLARAGSQPNRAHSSSEASASSSRPKSTRATSR